MASGVPAIVSNQGGPKFLIKNGETGFVAENFEEFVQYSVELMDNPEKMSKMKQLAREVVGSRSWDAVFEKVYEAYSETMKIAEGKNIPK